MVIYQRIKHNNLRIWIRRFRFNEAELVHLRIEPELYEALQELSELKAIPLDKLVENILDKCFIAELRDRMGS